MLLGLVVTSGCGGTQSGESNTEAKSKGYVVLTEKGQKKFVNDFCPEAHNFNEEYKVAKAKAEEYFTKELYEPVNVKVEYGKGADGDSWEVGTKKDQGFSINYMYMGPLVNNKPEGFGVIYNEISEYNYPRKYIYIGNFKNGMFDGYGLAYECGGYPNYSIYTNYSQMKYSRMEFLYGKYTYGGGYIYDALGDGEQVVPRYRDDPYELADQIADDSKYYSMSEGDFHNYIHDIERRYGEYDMKLEITNSFYYDGMINGLQYEGEFKDGVANGRGNLYYRDNFMYVFDNARSKSKHMVLDKELHLQLKDEALKAIEDSKKYIEENKNDKYMTEKARKQKIESAEQDIENLKKAVRAYDRIVENCNYLMEPVNKPTLRYKGNLYVISGNFNNGTPKGKFVCYRQGDTYKPGYKFYEMDGLGNGSKTSKMWLQDGTLINNCNYKDIWKHIAYLNKVESPHFVDFKLEVPEG